MFPVWACCHWSAETLQKNNTGAPMLCTLRKRTTKLTIGGMQRAVVGENAIAQTRNKYLSLLTIGNDPFAERGARRIR